MLNQASAKLDVQELNSVTDREERLVLRDRVAQQSAVGLLEVLVGCGRFRVWRRVVQGGIDVRRAAGQDDRVERLHKLAESLRRFLQRDFNGLAASALHCFDILFILAAHVVKFFISCAIRDSDAGFVDLFRAHGAFILPSRNEPGNRPEITAGSSFEWRSNCEISWEQCSLKGVACESQAALAGHRRVRIPPTAKSCAKACWT